MAVPERWQGRGVALTDPGQAAVVPSVSAVRARFNGSCNGSIPRMVLTPEMSHQPALGVPALGVPALGCRPPVPCGPRSSGGCWGADGTFALASGTLRGRAGTGGGSFPCGKGGLDSPAFQGQLLMGASGCSVPPSPPSSSSVPCAPPGTLSAPHLLQPHPQPARGLPGSPSGLVISSNYSLFATCSSVSSPLGVSFSETIMFLHQIFYQGLKARISSWPTLVLGECLLPPRRVSFLLAAGAQPTLFLLMQLPGRFANRGLRGNALHSTAVLLHVSRGGEDQSKKPRRTPVPAFPVLPGGGTGGLGRALERRC